MLQLLDKGILSSSLNQAAKQLDSDGFKRSTVMTAAHKFPSLASHFKLDGKADSVLDELIQQCDKPTQQTIEKLSPVSRDELEAELQQMDPQDALKLVRTLSDNPEAGRTGDVPVKENIDQSLSSG